MAVSTSSFLASRSRRSEEMGVFPSELWVALICEKNDPVVAVINGLENEDNMDDWWKRN